MSAFNFKTFIKIKKSFDDNGKLNKDVELNPEDIFNNYGCNFGCGIFEFKKK